MGVAGTRGGSQHSIPTVIVKLLLFFAVCTLLTAYLAFTIGNIHLFQHTYRLTATFDDATGLLKADNVKVAGVVVGRVSSVKIDEGKAKLHPWESVRKELRAAVRGAGRSRRRSAR